MNWKDCIAFFILFGLLLVSCSPVSDLETQGWPDNNDIATMISLTLTQRAERVLRNTPQPGEQVSESQENGEETAVVNPDEMVFWEKIATENASNDREVNEDLNESPDQDLSDGQEVTGTAQFVTATPTLENSGYQQTVVVTLTATEPSEVQVEEENEPTEEVAGIPGFRALVLVEKLIGFGFDCPEFDEQGEGAYKQQCVFGTEDYQLVVTIWGRTAESIDLIETTVFYFGNMDYTDLTSVFFEIIADISYDGAVPEDAKEWVSSKVEVIKSFGDEAFDEFGGVRYYIYALPSGQVFEIGRKQEN